MISINEDQQAAFGARLAAGDAPAINTNQWPSPNRDNYQTYVDLKEINYPYWDKFVTFDAKTVWESQNAISYTPSLVWRGGRYMSFIYYKEEMTKAGLNPRNSVRTWEDLDAFLQNGSRSRHLIGETLKWTSPELIILLFLALPNGTATICSHS